MLKGLSIIALALFLGGCVSTNHDAVSVIFNVTEEEAKVSLIHNSTHIVRGSLKHSNDRCHLDDDGYKYYEITINDALKMPKNNNALLGMSKAGIKQPATHAIEGNVIAFLTIGGHQSSAVCWIDTAENREYINAVFVKEKQSDSYDYYPNKSSSADGGASAPSRR